MLNKQHNLPPLTTDVAGKVIILEAPSGTSRRELLQQWLEKAQQTKGARTWLLPCNFDEGGAWAGLSDLLQDLVPRIERQAPHLIPKHSYELCLISPELRRRITVTHLALTDTAKGQERVRNYPIDRAYRSLHGLIDLLDSWYHLSNQTPWVIACDQYDQGSNLVQRFFVELLRRRGQALSLTLLLAGDPGQGHTLASQFTPSQIYQTVRLDLPTDTVSPSKESMTHAAQELEQQIELDPILMEIQLPRLIHLWQQSEFPEHALKWQVRAMRCFNKLGLWDASFAYCAEVEASLDSLYDENSELYPAAVSSIYFCYLSLGYVEQAYHVMTEKVIHRIHPQPLLSHNHYLMAMLYARFLRPRDLTKATEYLEQGLALIHEADLPDHIRYFYIVFLKNGLAYVRTQQGRAEEAIALCREGIETLNQYLEQDQHRLHRSVLSYNIAQTYAVTGPFEAALKAFTDTMEMDPNYSEYYNERGNVYFKMGRLHEAEQDYLQAIELSPPYAEVWINLGQCYREMERMEDAIMAYSQALDLDPKLTLPLAGRADAYATLGQTEAALADYNLALTLEPLQPQVLAARAIIHYEAGDRELAVHDLDTAIELSPQEPLFYQNRAIALADLGRVREAMQDLQTYLHLQPEAEDRDEVEQQLLALQTK